MKTLRFNNDGRLGARSRFFPRKYPHRRWIRVSNLGRRLSPWTGSGRKRIFAIVSDQESSSDGGKTALRVLIFDNHPDSLQLVFSGGSSPPIDRSPSHSQKLQYLILLAFLTLSGLTAMFWPLL